MILYLFSLNVLISLHEKMIIVLNNIIKHHLRSL